jgi:hypothetical protein
MSLFDLFEFYLGPLFCTIIKNIKRRNMEKIAESLVYRVLLKDLDAV